MFNLQFYSYLCSVIYPNNFERKLGFDEIRRLLKERCLSTLGKEKVDEMAFSTDCQQINEWLTQVREFRRLKEEKDDFPMQYFFDVREAVTRIRLENTHLEEDEVWDLRRSLETIANIVSFLSRSEERGVRSEILFVGIGNRPKTCWGCCWRLRRCISSSVTSMAFAVRFSSSHSRVAKSCLGRKPAARRSPTTL